MSLYGIIVRNLGKADLTFLGLNKKNPKTGHFTIDKIDRGTRHVLRVTKNLMSPLYQPEA